MYQKDYVLRMIEMLGTLIAAIMGKIKNGDYPAASEQLSNIYYDLLKEDAAYFRRLSPDELTDKLLETHDYTHGHLQILAELFNMEAELSFAKGDDNSALEYSNKSLKILQFIDTEQKTYSLERLNKMEAIRKRIESLQTK